MLKSCLTNRKQKCQIKNSFSKERLIKCGVQQGYIVGPLFFLLYINDCPECLNKTKPRLFADDTNVTASGDSIAEIEAAANSDLENLRKWLIANKLSLNVTKTEFMPIGSKPMSKNISDEHLNIFIENKQIKQVKECKTLGLTFHQHLLWKSNTENICKKNDSKNICSSSAKPFVDIDLVRPYFDYCCEVWDVFSES